VAGPAGRALVYKAFVGEYLYWNLTPHNAIELASESPLLVSGWSEARNRHGPPTYRWAFYPQACVRLPLLDGPTKKGLRTVVTARAPGGLAGQTMSAALNGRTVLEQAALTEDWTDVSFLLPAPALAAGENLLCLRFDKALPGDDGSRVAAAVLQIKLP